ncbi:MAG: hypothetical protein IJ417_02765 [Bacteroidaceae bacterium]|nr:hypothetical protein [Bacteroidaceae bacterium]
MKQKEIFREEDFEKEPPHKPSTIWRKSWLWLSLFFIIIICIYCIINCDKKTMPSPSPSPNVDSLDIIDGKTNNSIIASNDTLKRIESPTIPQESVKTKLDISLMAKRVIRGDYGNGIQRQEALGGDYEIIQEQVNRNYQKGDLYW